jgi:hypothetical protein
MLLIWRENAGGCGKAGGEARVRFRRRLSGFGQMLLVSIRRAQSAQVPHQTPDRIRRTGFPTRLEGALNQATASGMVEYAFETPNPAPDFWAFSDRELARCCVMVAESRSGPSNAVLRAEAMRLFLLWREAINARHRSNEQVEQGIAMLRSLRKRTIQVLVRLSLQGLLFIP